MAVDKDPNLFHISVVKMRDHKDAFPIHRGFPLGNIFPMNGDEKS